MSHVCNDQCDRLLLRAAHERSRLAARAKRQAKLHGRRPKVHRVSRDGMRVTVAWIDEVWALVEQQ